MNDYNFYDCDFENIKGFYVHVDMDNIIYPIIELMFSDYQGVLENFPEPTMDEKSVITLATIHDTKGDRNYDLAFRKHNQEKIYYLDIAYMCDPDDNHSPMLDDPMTEKAVFLMLEHSQNISFD